MPPLIKQHKGLFAAASAAIILTAAATVFLISFALGGNPVTPTEPTVTKPASTEPTLPQGSVTTGDFYFEGDFLLCSQPHLVGIDVSELQGPIDWASVKESGVEFAMIRLGYRGYVTGMLNTDARALENLQRAREAGILVGAYFFSQATCVEEAAAEAAYALEILGDFKLDLPLAYDWEPMERTKDVDGQTVTECVIAFCDAVAAGGRDPMLYFGSLQGQPFLELFQLTDYPWWLAWYNTEEEFYCRWNMWQYGLGTVPGIEGNTDLNILLLDGPV